MKSVEVVLMHCNLSKMIIKLSKVIFAFVPNKQFGQLINIAPHSLIMLNTLNTKFKSIAIWFTDQDSKP